MHAACVDDYKAFDRANIHQLISDCRGTFINCSDVLTIAVLLNVMKYI